MANLGGHGKGNVPRFSLKEVRAHLKSGGQTLDGSPTSVTGARSGPKHFRIRSESGPEQVLPTPPWTRSHPIRKWIPPCPSVPWWFSFSLVSTHILARIFSNMWVLIGFNAFHQGFFGQKAGNTKESLLRNFSARNSWVFTKEKVNKEKPNNQGKNNQGIHTTT